ncbi:hypothetical protein GCM10029976_052290 [Kribbella albertanoniae]|uniref:ESX-1 secretion-associated protein n=1 Tax=Kribbella albertanoniae TaxID=1266829 RepID=A0A4R4Q6H7_9ACTN|nr:hypothetical protein [Kribbella albertanoniae]TDC30463.1 hypothetical protein E1261_13340 [Kribbella albertanoniae]
MGKVKAGRMEMDTDVVRTSGSSLKATGTQAATDAESIIQRIVAGEAAIGTGSAADNFHLGYNLPATSTKEGSKAAAKTLGDLGTSMIEDAAKYEEIDQQYRAALDRARRA